MIGIYVNLVPPKKASLAPGAKWWFMFLSYYCYFAILISVNRAPSIDAPSLGVIFLKNPLSLSKAMDIKYGGIGTWCFSEYSYSLVNAYSKLGEKFLDTN